MRWLVTGGCGFIGTSLISHLIKNNLATGIRVLDNLSVGTKEDLAEVCSFVEAAPSLRNPLSFSKLQVELVVGDIRDYETCFKVSEAIDIVVHLAANTGVGPSVEDPRKDLEANVIGTFNMLEAARYRQIQRFIFASSGAPLGEVLDPPIHEEKTPRPVSPYGASKLAGEGYCSVYARTFGIKTVSLRFGNVYGVRSKHKSSVVAKFFKQALQGKILEIYGDGTQTRDFIFIDDLLQAITLSTKVSEGGEVFQIATHRETTVNEVAEMVKTLVERETNQRVVLEYGRVRQGDVKRNYSDISKAKRLLGYEPKVTLSEGLRRTFFYFKSMNVEKT